MADQDNKLHEKLALYPARIIACSGGIDSLVLATLAHRASPVLCGVVQSVPVVSSSQGFIWIFIDNPNAGRICSLTEDAPAGRYNCPDMFEAFHAMYPGIEVLARARHNRWTSFDEGLEDQSSLGYDEIFNAGN